MQVTRAPGVSRSSGTRTKNRRKKQGRAKRDVVEVSLAFILAEALAKQKAENHEAAIEQWTKGCKALEALEEKYLLYFRNSTLIESRMWSGLAESLSQLKRWEEAADAYAVAAKSSGFLQEDDVAKLWIYGKGGIAHYETKRFELAKKYFVALLLRGGVPKFRSITVDPKYFNWIRAHTLFADDTPAHDSTRKKGLTALQTVLA